MHSSISFFQFLSSGIIIHVHHCLSFLQDTILLRRESEVRNDWLCTHVYMYMLPFSWSLPLLHTTASMQIHSLKPEIPITSRIIYVFVYVHVQVYMCVFWCQCLFLVQLAVAGNTLAHGRVQRKAAEDTFRWGHCQRWWVWFLSVLACQFKRPPIVSAIRCM